MYFYCFATLQNRSSAIMIAAAGILVTYISCVNILPHSEDCKLQIVTQKQGKRKGQRQYVCPCNHTHTHARVRIGAHTRTEEPTSWVVASQAIRVSMRIINQVLHSKEPNICTQYHGAE